MAKSPLTPDQNIVTLSVLIEGTTLDDTLAVNKIEVTSKIGEIPSAKVTLLAPAGRRLMEAMEELAPGKNIEIKLGYQQDDQLVFSGVITNQSVESTEGQGAFLMVDCHDKALALDKIPDNQLFSDLTDTEIISAVLNESGFPLEVDNTVIRHQRLSQFQMTDWDFIQARAKANHLLAYAENGKVLVKASAIASEPDLRLTQGQDVLSFQLNTKANDSEALQTGARKLLTKGKKIAPKSNLKPSTARSSDPTITVTGELTFFGNASPHLNSTIQLAGFGAQFNGKHLITGFHHLAEEGQWATTVNIGLAAVALEKTPPPLPGILTGKVLELAGDPLEIHRILVDVPDLDTTGSGLWARPSSFYATHGKGAFFLPEIGDEVILGFEENDLAQPVVLGALYSSEQALPFSMEDDNPLKGILTRSGLKLEFDDENAQLTLATPANNTIVLSDDASSIVISDQHGNQITMDASGIKIKSSNNIELEAPGEIVVNAGVNVEIAAGASFSAQGNAHAEVKSGGITKVEGSMVMIN
jgi:uncharacterized protein involved in type VI secretion and phage assembly